MQAKVFIKGQETPDVINLDTDKLSDITYYLSTRKAGDPYVFAIKDKIYSYEQSEVIKIIFEN